MNSLCLSQKLIGFPPIVSKNPKIMILGSMPGVESLNRQEYYAYPRNQFWEILRRLLKQNELNSYADKRQMMIDNNIILWDVIHSCRRNGLLDSSLRDVKINNFKQLIKKQPTLEAVFCNGQTAFKLFKRYNPEIKLLVIALPSTSPAYTLSFNQKLAQWRQILEFT